MSNKTDDITIGESSHVLMVQMLHGITPFDVPTKKEGYAIIARWVKSVQEGSTANVIHIHKSIWYRVDMIAAMWVERRQTELLNEIAQERKLRLALMDKKLKEGEEEWRGRDD